MRIRFWMLGSVALVLGLSACSQAVATAPVAPAPTTTWTALPTRTAIPSATSLPSPTVRPSTAPRQTPASSVSQPSPTMDLTCETPKSLMLHSAFGPQRMLALAQAIEARGWQTITYRDVLTYLQQGECPPENAIIVSIDDLGTNWLRYDFIPMVQTFIEHDMVLVLGAVVEGPQDPEVWALFKQWQEAGIEIASHSLSHYDLPALRDEALEEQCSVSYDIICEQLGTCPITFILTFGKGGDDPRVVAAAREYTFLVGIQGGRVFGSQSPYYLGRIPPHNGDQQITLNLLEISFGQE